MFFSFSHPATLSPRQWTVIDTLQNLKRQGQEQNAQGKEQEAAGQLNDFGSGVANRATGAVGGAIAGLTGDREAQIEAQKQHDIGKTQQRGAEADIQKQNS